MATAQTTNANGVRHRCVLGHKMDDLTNPVGIESKTDDAAQWHKHVQRVKVKILQQVQDQLSDILDTTLTEPVHASVNGKTSNISSPSRMDDGKVFMDRASLLDELFEISHIRTIYHMFVAVLIIFCVSTLAVDYIDQGRLVLEFDLLFYAFGKLGTVTWVWALMFVYTLLVPYYTLLFWGSFYHRCPSKLGLSVCTALVLAALQASVLGLLPIYAVVQHQLPPASRFIVILEQIRFLMKSYSFMRESAPEILKNTPKQGEKVHIPTFSTYLYFLFCPTLIYRESYPRNTHIRWKYVGVTVTMILGCLFYGYFILVRLCVPVFTSESHQPFSKRAMVLAVFHSILPGIMLLLLCFFAFLHCWLNLFAELLQFADRMFYKLSRRKFRTGAMLSVFIVSAVVHEYALAMGFGFFYPVMFFLFAIFGVVFNFTMNDKRQSPVCNIIMWLSLFVGQGVQVCLYCQEWYAQIRCPRTGNSIWELVTPRSWSCSHQK
ncbi:sterol O-acyltransferase 2 isoform X3 [Corythoichthys intestinalis]|uniref:sterol O-acyltransferase 2 isoform X3 n=1 Tax=Corythoichthys intestinalis TaxID=161448 RepID=UPI0025A625CC|nr:sterol O-acyltransferase 2 isoform X3 [Corythoichthys intestinalis]